MARRFTSEDKTVSEYQTEADMVAEYREANPTAEEIMAATAEKRSAELTPEQLEEIRFEEWTAGREKQARMKHPSVLAPVEDFVHTLKFLGRVDPNRQRKPEDPNRTPEAQRLIAEDVPERPPYEPNSFMGTLRKLVTDKQRLAWKLPTRADVYVAPRKLLQTVADKAPDLLDKIKLPSERRDARRDLLANLLGVSCFSRHKERFLDGEALLIRWEHLSSKVRAFIDAPVEKLAKASPAGQIRFDGDLPMYAEAMLKEGFFVEWLNEIWEGTADGK